MDYIKKPMDIELKSFEIITNELGEKANRFSKKELPIVKRVIHTTADFNYADILEFSHGAIEDAMEALKRGCRIYTDTKMIKNGLSAKNLSKFGVEVVSLVSDPEVIKEAKELGITRSMVAMEKAIEDEKTEIFLIGNAPTALFTLMEKVRDKNKPALVVGVPVGFVGAEESKDKLAETDLNYIITRGRKGGSTVAVAILHAILYQLFERTEI